MTSARVALTLKRNGITRIRPLHGGIALWVERQYPVEKLLVGAKAGA